MSDEFKKHKPNLFSKVSSWKIYDQNSISGLLFKFECSMSQLMEGKGKTLKNISNSFSGVELCRNVLYCIILKVQRCYSCHHATITYKLKDYVLYGGIIFLPLMTCT